MIFSISSVRRPLMVYACILAIFIHVNSTLMVQLLVSIRENKVSQNISCFTQFFDKMLFFDNMGGVLVDENLIISVFIGYSKFYRSIELKIVSLFLCLRRQKLAARTWLKLTCTSHETQLTCTSAKYDTHTHW